MADQHDLVEYLRKVTTDLQKTRSRLRDVEGRNSEPIAIVGMGCRFPGGVRSPQGLWDLVREGRDAVGGFPVDRGWDVEGLYDPDPDALGKSYTREGGFLAGVDRFDADFFGVAPREAQAIDPQHRLLLETAWEALEDAAIRPVDLRGSRTGVFVGIMHQDYGTRFRSAPDGYEGYITNGTAASAAAGRLSYLYGLEGPAVTVDTACSSSLVALHLACQALRNRECDIALAGGATVMSTPTFFVEYSRQRVLSADGRCRAYADDGDGVGWSEGAGVLAVERLADARRNGHRVLAVVRGSAVNQDGASNGFSAPNGPSQERVIQAALGNARLTADQVDVVEGHGTGTRLGDPIEAQALIATYGQAHGVDKPLYLGSLKSNIGHAQAAAGVGGIIKMVMAMRHGVMPRSLYADNPTTVVDWSDRTVQLLADARPWDAGDAPRRAAVSSFGMSGTNAHVILEELAEDPASPAVDGETDVPAVGAGVPSGVVPLVLSAKSGEALSGQAAALRDVLVAAPGVSLGDVAWSLVATRSVFDHRAVVVGDRAEVLSGLGALAGSVPVVPGVSGGGRLGVVFSGQGSQRVGMGRELAGRFPVFGEALAEVCAVVDPLLGSGLCEVMWSSAGDADEVLGRTEFAQPALFAFELALARLWQSWGVRFAAVTGHSVGEIAGAVVAGVLGVADAARLVVARGRLMQALPSGGAMLAVNTGEDVVAAALEGVSGVAVAAVNAPDATVVSGGVEEIERLQEHFGAEGVRTSRLRVSHAFHSHLMEPMLEEFRAVLETLDFHEPSIPVSPAADSTHAFNSAAYWVDHARNAVRFHDAVNALPTTDTLVELGPDAALTPVLAEQRTVAAATRRNRPEVTTVLEALGHAYTHGVAVEWSTVIGAGQRVELPTYAFQYKSFWLAAPEAEAGTGTDAVDHPLLPGVVELPGNGGLLFSGRLSPASSPWLADHAVFGSVIFAGTGFLELAAQAARHAGSAEIADLVLQAPLELSSGGVDVQVWVAAPGESAREFVIRARRADGQWTVHATGTLGEPAAAAPAMEWAAGSWPPADAEQLPVDGLYDELSARGYTYGPAFRGLRAAWRAGDDVFAEVELPQDEQDARFGLHPALLDSSLHTLAFADEGYHDEVRLPFSFARTTLHTVGAAALRVRLSTADGAVRLEAATPAGSPVVSTERLVLRTVDAEKLREGVVAAARSDGWRHEVVWRKLPLAAASVPVPGTWLVLTPGGPDTTDAPDTVWLKELFDDVLSVALDEAGDRAGLAARLPVTGVAGVLCLAQRPEDVLVSLQALEDAGLDARVWCLTQGMDEDLDAAAVWGLGRVAALELPHRWGGLVDLPTTGVEEVTGQLAAVLTADSGEDQLRVRGDGVHVRRLTKAAPDRSRTADAPSGTVLITGGSGALAGHVARWLAEAGDCSLVLVSRRGPDAPGAAELLAELTARGAEARIVAADVTDRAAMAALVDEAAAAGTPVRGVFHTAGVGAQQPLLETSPAELRAVMAAKVEGARVLDEVLGDTELDAFVLFSSISGTWGAAGQSGYAAANAALDALAVRRRARGLAGTSLAWGPWAGGGLVDADFEQQLRRRGLPPLPVPGAVSALAASVSLGTDAVLVDVRWPRFLPSFTATRPARLFADFASEAGERVLAAPSTELAGVAVPDRGRVLLDLVRARVAEVVGRTDPAAIDPDRPLRELGFDSLMSVELRNKLSEAAGIRLASTMVFDYPTPLLLAGHLEVELFGAGAEEDSAARRRSAGTEDDPIVIVGIGCRYPGEISTPDELWQLVSQGHDAVGPLPADRGWDIARLYDPDPERAGTFYVKEGGFVADPAGFDARFFGIAPREALAMDPQQRLLLETAWEATEHAGIDPQSLRGTRTGVFAGAMYNDYFSRLKATPEELEGIIGIANSNSVMSGRISYLLGLEGPAITVDTACSSSLVTLHLACESLRRGECDLAFAGGATVMASPGIFIEFSRQGGLAPDGRSKSFSAQADGTGWSEGAGMLVLERLSDARRAGHDVLAVVRGSAVNQDGASNGLTAPNGPAQERVIRTALDHAGLSTADVDVVEAHGTGTRLGDPIEAQALLATYGRNRDTDSPLYLGSVKSNIGHTQAAAGVAGVIKMVQALRHETLPRTLHADAPSPEVDWSAGTVRLLTEARPWPRGTRPRAAAVSSFGISGTNAHVVLAEGDPIPVPPPARETGPLPVPLSARTPEGLPAQARALLRHLSDPETAPGLPDVAWSLATTRSAFPHRAMVVAANREELLAGLSALADPDAVRPDSVASGEAGRGRTVLMFPGQGSQWLGMARELLAHDEVFAAALRECADALAPWTEWSLLDVLADEDAAATAPVDVIQPVLFAVMVSLARVWRHWGVEVDGVVGHSQGEIAAACVAGALSLQDAARVVAVRSRLLSRLTGHSGLLSVALSEQEALDRLDGRTTIAVINGPSSVVVAGPDDALGELADALRADGVRVRRVEVDYASHSPEMEPLRDSLVEALEGITPSDGTVPFYSTVTGNRIAGGELGPEYWYRNLRETVRMRAAVETLAADGFTFFVESSPHPGLVVGVRETLEAIGVDGVVLGSLRRDDGGRERMLRSLAEGWAHGLRFDWEAVLEQGGRVPLPTYAFQRERYWLDAADTAGELPVSEVDARFWDAVEREDLGHLAGELGEVDGLDQVLPALAGWRRRSRLRSRLDSWRYRITWRAQQPRPAVPHGRWLLLDPATDESAAVRTALGEAGLAFTALTLGAADTDRAVLGDRLARAADGETFEGVLSLLALDERPHPALAGLTTGLALSVAVVQALGDTGGLPPVWAVTTGAVGVGTAPLRPAQNQVWGLGRVAALEHPDRWGGLVDLPVAPGTGAVTALLAVLADDGDEDQWAVRESGAWVRRLARYEPPAGTAPWQPTGTVLITGASGSLGPHLARSVVERGARHVALLSRRGADSPGFTDLVAELAETGATVSVFACDVRDRAGLAAVLESLARSGHPVTTAVHAAAFLNIGSLDGSSLAEFADVVDAKVAGAVNLAELLDRRHLRELVLFSSIAGVWGSGDHGAYAAANAHLDAFAERCREDGLPVVSVAWGIWDEQTTKDRTDAELVIRRGLPFMERATGFEGLYEAMAGDEAFVAVADVDWSSFAPVFTSARRSPLIADLPEAAREPEGGQSAGRQATERLRGRLAGMTPADRERTVVELVQAHAAAVLGFGSDATVAPGQDFRQTGMDSLLSVELRNRLARATGLTLPPTLVFDHATPDRLGAYLLGELVGQDTASAEALIGRLDGIEAEIRSMAADDTARLRLSSRISALLTAVRGTAGTAAGLEVESADTTEELLDLLDSEFGES
ncbi:SDR family NAD(P)-dependent oxidoreductase [Streptomyces sp. SL13]|uniref:SDR family NAD(P)-dependent oxidoreductase n=1 Tax=Streptantibioticus silvisoli TaxID=2705255 RepID=A0AA90K758_9ACTN|nr:type I polyketide synthase [Streptantibioticus silvisoli]MDI5968593.1 SDR family NAD(P)-dependent oxidoreductase [Streptantibioticus silvisoli]